MKYVIIIIAFILIGCKERLNTINDCDLLDLAISSEYFLKEFKLCKNKNKEFILYDKEKYFNNCSKIKICKKYIILSSHKKYSKINPNNHLSQKYQTIIVLHKVEKHKSIIKLYFWRPYSGAAVNLTYKINGKNIKLIDYEIGTF